jgi:hypothetical protein
MFHFISIVLAVSVYLSPILLVGKVLDFHFNRETPK